jgi:hypothetical protein
MHPASAETFQALRIKMETEWTPQMMEMLKIDEDPSRSSGTRTFFMVAALRPAKIRMCSALSVAMLRATFT